MSACVKPPSVLKSWRRRKDATSARMLKMWPAVRTTLFKTCQRPEWATTAQQSAKELRFEVTSP